MLRSSHQHNRNLKLWEYIIIIVVGGKEREDKQDTVNQTKLHIRQITTDSDDRETETNDMKVTNKEKVK